MHKRIYILSALFLFCWGGLQAQFTLKFPDQEVRCGESFVFPVLVEDFVDIRGVQLSINFDPAALEFVSANNVGFGPNPPSITQNFVSEGKLGLSWFTGTPLTLQDDDTLMTVTLLVNNGNLSSSPLVFSDDFIPIEITRVSPVDGSLERIPAVTPDANITLLDNTPPTISCPAGQSVLNAGGNDPVTINSGLTPLSLSDNCGTSVAQNYTLSGATSGSGNGDLTSFSFNVGLTEILYTATDLSGNTNTCTIPITVSSAGTVANLGLSLEPVNVPCTDTVFMPIIISDFDSITNLGFTLGWDANNFSFVGIDQFAINSMDISDFDLSQSANGNVSLSWSDASPQSLNNSAVLFNLKLYPSTIVNGSAVTISGPSAQKNGNALPVNVLGNGTVTTTANNFSLTCPDNRTVTLTAGTLQASFDDLDVVVNGNCGTTSTAYAFSGATTGGGVGDANNVLFNIGTTQVTYTVTNAVGTVRTCAFTVEVVGVVAQQFTLIAESKTVACDANDIAININVAAFRNISGTEFSIHWNPAILNFNNIDNELYVNGNFGPIDNVNGRINYSWFDGSTDGQTLPDGSTLFTMHFSPNSGGTANVEFADIPNAIEITRRNNGVPEIIPRDSISLLTGMVMVEDVTAPTISCPASRTVNVGVGESEIIVNDIDFVANDNCGPLTTTYSLSGATTGSGIGSASGTTFRAGETTVTYTTMDGAGLEASCQFTVVVAAPNAITVTPTLQEIVCGDELFQVDMVVDDFTDASGLQFTFEWDNTILMYDSKSNFGLAEISDNEFNENFVDDGQIAFAWANNNEQSLPNGSVLFSLFFKLSGANGGMTSFNFSDAITTREATIRLNGVPIRVPFIGNSRVVDVNEMVDNLPPTVTNPLPSAITLFVGADNCTAIAEFTPPTFADDCSEADNLLILSDIVPGSSLEIGETTIRYFATDEAGNTTIDSTVVTVRDNTGPVISGCPDNISIVSDVNCQAVVNWTIPTATDNCQFGVISGTHQPGNTFGLGTTTVIYTAEDVYGNRSICSFDVTVVAGNPLAFENFPGDITVNATQGECGATIGWIPPTVTGGCGDGSTVTIVGTSEPNTFFPVGAQAVQYTATDGGGQSISETFVVTVVDNQEIVVICPTDIEIGADGTVLMDEGNFINSVTTDTCGQYVITFNDITAFDNCSPISQTQTAGLTNGSIFPFGTTAMAFELADTLGNSLNCTFQIKISETADLEAVTLDDPNCAGSDLRLSVDTVDGGSYQWNGPGGFSSPLQNPVIPNAMTQNSGDYIVKVVTDNGCLVKDSVSVGILSAPTVEASSPGLDCGNMGDTIRLFANITNGIPATFSWTGPGGFATTVQNPLIIDAGISNVGIYTVTATTGNGCATTATVVVDFSGMVMPTIASDAGSDTVCANLPFTLTGTAYEGLVNYEWIAPTGAGLPADRDTNIIVVTPTEAGTYTYQYTANLDGNCSSDTASIDLVVLGGAGAVTISSNGPFDCAALNDNIELSAIGGDDIVAYAWTGPNDFASTEQNPIIPVSNAAAGTYNLVATSANGCTASNSMEIAVTAQGDAPEVALSSANNNVCEGDNLTLTAEDVPGATYAWVGPNGFTSDQQVITFANITADDAGAYQVKTSVNGCESVARTVGPILVISDPAVMDDPIDAIRNQSINFSVIANDGLIAGAPFTITVLSDAANGTLTNNGDGTFIYNPDADYVGMDQMLYELCYDDCPDLCGMGTITVRTEFPPGVCIVPTLITPNGDGFNDALVISCVSDPPKIGSELIVWNEWGSEVFRETPYQNNWQGTHNGKDLPDGTYYYVFKEDSDDNDPVKGYVTIFR